MAALLTCIGLAAVASYPQSATQNQPAAAIAPEADRALDDRASRSMDRAAQEPPAPSPMSTPDMGGQVKDLTVLERAAFAREMAAKAAVEQAAAKVAAEQAAAERAAKAAARKAAAERAAARKAATRKAAAAKEAAAKAAAAKAAAARRAAARVIPVAGLSQSQMTNAKHIVRAGQALGLPKRAFVLAVACAMQESTLRNLASDAIGESFNYPNEGSGSDHDSVGLFQQRPSAGWGTVKQLMTPAYAAEQFYEALLGVPGWQSMALTYAVQKVQVSAYPEAYAKHEWLAETVVDALT